MPSATSDPSITMMTVCGHPLRVRDAGPKDTEALLIVNGAAASLEVLDSLITLLAQSRRVIAFDQPGMGGSPATYPTLLVPTLSRMATNILRDRGVTKADVLGYSFGGAIAQHIALTRPDLVRRQILVSSVYGTLGIPSDPISNLVVLGHQTPAQAMCRAYARKAYGGVVARDEAALDAYEKAIEAAPPDPISFLGQAVAMSLWPVLPWLWALRAPTLVITGDEDHVVPLANARLIAALLPDAHLEILPGAGHLLLMDQAAESAALIEAFLTPGLAVATDTAGAKHRRGRGVVPLDDYRRRSDRAQAAAGC